MVIQIARLGTSVKRVDLDTGCVDDALTTSGQSVEGFQIRVNGKIVTGSHSLHDGDVITLVLADGIRGEATISVAGKTWRVHRHDPDCIWPSDFHAHSLSDTETLNIHNGDVWNPKNGQFTRKLKPKHLNRFRQELDRRGICYTQKTPLSEG